ncbi:ROK family protein [Alicyclobacillus fodiniaquatilis]|uniref:ROK family protein n=1 Tax=Alicyclobacillus fodiniaquatilis TaxID=1661150 RepID=A0ABW4JKN3_9BACL
MATNYVLAFDVGGTSIQAGVISETGEVMQETLAVYDALAHGTKDEIITHMVDLIEQQMDSITQTEHSCLGIGYAFPGPFDYQRGISLIRGLNKFESLYQVDVRQAIQTEISQRDSIRSRLHSNYPLMFENDARLFALGETFQGKGRGYQRAICLTLGTGLGSAFVEQGMLIRGERGIPEQGWVYDMPFKESIVDDYVSRRGILRLASSAGIDTSVNDVKEIAQLATQGDAVALFVMAEFGMWLGTVLRPFVESFQPDVLIFGGQIARSYPLFATGLQQGIGRDDVVCEVATDVNASTLLGVYRMVTSWRTSKTR